jgi:DNA polymerase-3 subunit delta
MKIQARQIDSFVKSPDKAARVILVYGPDSGLMKERAQTIGRTVVQDLNDPFNVCVLSGDKLIEDPARLRDESSAISMMGGDRLIRIEEAGDRLTLLIREYLENPSPHALVILEGDNLGASSSLRKLCESASNAAAIPCYVEDERDMARFINETLRAENVRIEPDAVAWLAANITGNRQRARSEIEKLIIFKGRETSAITLLEAQSACGSAGAQNLDDLVYSVGGRRSDSVMNINRLLQDEGVNFIVILRSLQSHFRKLHLARSRTELGDSAESAMKALRPPIFFKHERDFQQQIQNWSLPSLMKVLERLSDLEAQCKQTGAPTETLCAQVMLGITMMRG